MLCPLCLSPQHQLFFEDAKRRYLECQHCALVFVPPAYHLQEACERAEYEKHENDVNDQGYRGFLARLHSPLSKLLVKPSFGLDFGCGPGPALARMFEEQGHDMVLFDKYFYSDVRVLETKRQFDFICATEVIEHLHYPGDELKRLWRLLKPGGYLGLMSKLVISQEKFATWHYKNDPTHICFFSTKTLTWLATTLDAELQFVASDAYILKKRVDAGNR